MNPLKRLYCRAFQLCFRLVLPILPYREPKILPDMPHVAEMLREKNITRVLIITDKGISSLHLLDGLTEALDKQQIFWAVFDETVANPTIRNVEAAKDCYERHHCQAIVAFGGGSSMDCAKAAGARIAKPRQSVARMRGLLKVHKRLPLLIAVPTTAGTGSETTLAAVITDDETRHKYPINDFVLIPDYAVLDYRVTLGLPPMITATTTV